MPGEGGADGIGGGIADAETLRKMNSLNAGRKLIAPVTDLDDFLLKAREAAVLGQGRGVKRDRDRGESSGAKQTVGGQLALRASATFGKTSAPRGGSPGGSGGMKKKKSKKSRRGRSKKKKKKKRKTRRGTRSGGGGGPGGSSPSSSSSSSSRSSSSGKHSKSSSSADSLRPPLQRRSRREAGSVLRLLIRQVEEQLSELQGADAPTGALLSGTKMVSYYHLMIKGGGIQVNSRDGRELFLLSNLIDLLRMGKLDLLGDGLASRFLAIQQAQIDNNWSAARHLEIYTPEVQTAAGASMTLEARRHARLIEKAQGIRSNRGRTDQQYQGSWSKGGSWTSSPWDGYAESPKGKGKKGKLKNKGGSGQGKGGGNWRGGSAVDGAGKGDNKEKSAEKEREK